MTNRFRAFALLSAALFSTAALAEPNSSCPITLGTDEMLGPPFPAAQNWYGSEALAVGLPGDGRWGVTRPGARIAVKLFVWSADFATGMERHLSVEIEGVDGRQSDAEVKDITNARLADDSTAMLAGIDFPTAGCWRIRLHYLGQSLAFVVETAGG